MLGIAPPPQTGSLSTKPAHYSGGYLFVLIYSQPYTQAEGGCGGGGEEGAAEGGGGGRRGLPRAGPAHACQQESASSV